LTLSYLPYHQIDKKKWDDCIAHSINRLIYAESIYLDSMSSNWDAIVMNDYEAVMPLIWNRKFGIKYLYQPTFLQQGGVFCKQAIDEPTIIAFIEQAKQHFRYGEITLNFYNKLLLNESSKYLPRKNYILPLEASYDEISNQFKKSVKEKIKKIHSITLTYKKEGDFRELIFLFKKLYNQQIKLKNKNFENFEKLCLLLNQQNRLIIRTVEDEHKELLSGVILFFDGDRMYNLLPCNTKRGKEKLANYFLYNNLINEFSSNKIILDFEGSDIPGVEQFYRGFTQENQSYLSVTWNKLPFPINLIKK